MNLFFFDNNFNIIEHDYITMILLIYQWLLSLDFTKQTDSNHFCLSSIQIHIYYDIFYLALWLFLIIIFWGDLSEEHEMLKKTKSLLIVVTTIF